ncbi:MAG TPA: tetratricopeptide repeat protein, partial [Gammaproteobacteria bacterium]|nr:tetratricopeptide repeat protein [Gammaproteobacteria bacterium]
MTTRTMLRLATLITPVVLAGCSGLTPDYGNEWTSRHFADPYQVGKAQYAAGQYGLAVKSFKAAVDTDPGSVESLNALAASYDKLGRFDLSARYYGRALALAPKDTQTLNNIGYSYLLQKRYDLAVAYLRDAHAAAQDDPVVLANRKVAEVALQDADLERSRAAAAPDTSADTAQAPASAESREQHSSAAAPPTRGPNRSSSREPESVAAASPATRGPNRPWIERTAPQIQTLITEPQYAMTEEAEDAGVAPELANYKTPETVLPKALDAPIRDNAAAERSARAEEPAVPPVDSAARVSRTSEPETPEPVQLAAVPREPVERVALGAPRKAPESKAVDRPVPEALQVAEARTPAPMLGPRMAPVPIVPVQVAALPEPEASPAPDLGKSLTDEAIAPEPRIQV